MSFCIVPQITVIETKEIEFQRHTSMSHHGFFFILFYYSYVHTMLGSFLPPCPHPLPYHPLRPLPLPPTPSILGRNYFALISNFVVERV
jgi:hypothetical protein